MSTKHLGTYLNDHLAGSVMALELLEHLKGSPGLNADHFVDDLQAEITADQKELEGLIERLGVGRSAARRVLGWLGEKATQLKLTMDDAAEDPLRRFESLEVLSLGIEGKRSLWKALEAAAVVNPGLQGPNYARLQQRAAEQRQRVEKHRLEASKGALQAG